MSVPRYKIKTMCSQNIKPHVFQVNPPKCYVSISNITDLLNLTSFMSESKKKTIFETYGADYDKVVKYYKHVIYIKKMWQIS
jgi:hypothetical protein